MTEAEDCNYFLELTFDVVGFLSDQLVSYSSPEEVVRLVVKRLKQFPAPNNLPSSELIFVFFKCTFVALEVDLTLSIIYCGSINVLYLASKCVQNKGEETDRGHYDADWLHFSPLSS
jgi:hypothetical protein